MATKPDSSRCSTSNKHEYYTTFEAGGKRMKYTAYRKTDFSEQPTETLAEAYLGQDIAACFTECRTYVIDGVRHMYAESRTKKGVCPFCGKQTSKRHGTTTHSAQWLPLDLAIPTILHLKLSRFYCTNPECEHYDRTFTEQVERLSSFKRNSENIFLILFAISLFCSCNGTVLIAKQLGIDVSRETVKALINSVEIQDDPDVECIGVDDVANYKGVSYLTAIYDANDHHLLALLDGRDGKTLKEWLKCHKKVKVVARDRASAYAAAIREILPDCIQVADPFHILKNLTDRFNEIFKADLPSRIYIRNHEIVDEKSITPVYRPRGLITDPAAFDGIHYDNSAPIDKDGNIIKVNTKEMNHKGKKKSIQAANRIKKKEKTEQVRDLYHQARVNGEKMTYKALAEKVGVSAPTVKKMLSMSDEEVQKLSEIHRHKKHHASKVDGYENIIYKMLADHMPPYIILSYLLYIGCPANPPAIKDRIANIAKNHFTGIGKRAFDELVMPADITIVNRFDVLKYMVANDRNNMKDIISDENYRLIKDHYSIVQRCEDAWNLFYPALMEKRPDDIDRFIDKYRTDKAATSQEFDSQTDVFSKQIGTFVNGLEKDIDAVKAAATYDINSGFVEGNNCKFKEVKRVLFGRASLVFLQKHFYISSVICKCGTSARELLNQRAKNLPQKKNRGTD